MHYQWNKYWGKISTKIIFGDIFICGWTVTFLLNSCKEEVCNIHDELTKNQIHKEISYYRILSQISSKPLLSHLDYLNWILSGLPDSAINHMQGIQNYGAKLLLGKTKYYSSTAVLMELQWLPVRSRIKFRTLTLVFKCIKGDAPNYFKNLLIRCAETSWTLRFSNIKDCLVIPQTVRKTFAAWSVSVVGPMFWNNLPNYIKGSNNVNDAKKKNQDIVICK